jgi:SM-20-related protein
MLNLAAITGSTAVHEPFDYIVAHDVLPADVAAAMSCDFPEISDTGTYPISELRYGPTFRALVDDLRSAGFAQAVGQSLKCDFRGLPQLITVRGYSGSKDGFVHTDSDWKLVTVLLYLNPEWSATGGRLRLLRSKDVDDMAIEVLPRWGTLVAFRPCARSFHGHLPFHGERRLIQVNWVSDATYVAREERRHRRSAALKAVLRALSTGWTRTVPDAHRDR